MEAYNHASKMHAAWPDHTSLETAMPMARELHPA
jgi:hypothetical protein